MNRTLRFRIAACTAVLLIGMAPSALLASGGNITAPKPTANFSISKEFYITFPQNLHEGAGPLQLTCFIASNYHTKGKIEILGPGTTVLWSQNFTVDSQSITSVLVDNKAEIPDVENEIVERKAVHIIADQPIVVYGLDRWPHTTDGYLAIPPSAWGTDYRVASYYGITRTDDPAFGNIRATSQFALVAAYNNTQVTITLSDNTMNANGVKTHDKGSVVQVIMNKGDVYQMQAEKVPGSLNDLSLTAIASNKPVGLLAGCKCTDVPKGVQACDNLLEMIPPTQTWGKEYFTFPFDVSRTAGDSWRVFPLLPGTEVYINGADMGPISPDDPVSPIYETNDGEKTQLNSAAHWEFSKPVLMCQYINGEQFDNSDHGDPSMVVLETREEFQTGVLFATPSDDYKFTNYLNVMICDTAGATSGLRDSLYLDGRAIKNLQAPYLKQNEVRIPGTNFYAIHIKLPGGVHRLKALTPFTAYSVGLGDYESYAWACGLALKNIAKHDTVAPILPIKLTCGEMRDSLRDLPHDTTITGIGQIGNDVNSVGWLYLSGKDSTYNFDNNVFTDPSNFVPGDTVTGIHVKVTNIRQNAHGALHAVDLADNDTTFYFDYIADSVATDKLLYNFGNVGGGSTRLDTIIMTNPLNQPVKIDSFWLLGNTLFTITSGFGPFPMTIPAGKTAKIVVKYSPLVDGLDLDTVMIKFDCFTRILAYLQGGSGHPCLTTTDLDFGTLTLVGGTATSTLFVSLGNPGTDSLIITKLAIGGGAGSAFKIISPNPTPASPVIIHPFDTLVKVNISFTPSASIAYADSLIVTANGTASCSDNVGALTGAAQAPGPHVSSFDFGSVRQGCDSSNYIYIWNDGNSADKITKFIGPPPKYGDFTMVNPPTLPYNLGASGSGSDTLRLVFTFSPSATGSRNNSFQVQFGSGSTQTSTLKGIGTYRMITSADVAFGTIDVNSTLDSFAVATNVVNAFGDKLTLSDVTITPGANSGDFTIIDKNIPHDLTKDNDTMRAMIRFKPSSNGPKTAQLCFHFNSGLGSCMADTTICVNLTGAGKSPGIEVTDWDAQRVFITTTRVGNDSIINTGLGVVHVTGLSLAQGKYFAIDYGPLRTQAAPFDIQPTNGVPVYFKFTPTDTVTYYDTLLVANNSATSVAMGYLTGVGKVVVYTATVPAGIHGAYGFETKIPVTVMNNGYTRPSPYSPLTPAGDPTKIDSGVVSAMRIGVQVDPTVLIARTKDNQTIDLTGAGTAGPATTVTRIITTPDSVSFTLTGGPVLDGSDTLLATVRYQTLYAPTPGSPINLNVSSSSPWVIWKVVPGLFFLDSICGLGSSVKIVYVGGAFLQQSIPNPATVSNGNPYVSIPFELERDMNIHLALYNSMGAEMARLADGPMAKGAYAAPVNIARLPAGVYYYRLVSEGAVQTRTMVVAH